MIPLSAHFSKNGFTFEQIRRSGNCAVYWKHKPSGARTFEVIRIQSHNGHTFPNGTVAPPSEFYPSSEELGTYGFTCATIEMAEAKLAHLIGGKEAK